MRTRSSTIGRFTLALVTAALGGACGDDGGDDGITPDAAAETTGFEKPTEPLHANVANADVGPADLSCLGTPASVVTASVEVALTAQVIDFQSDDPVESVSVTAFPGIAIASPFGAAATSDPEGNVTLIIPQGTGHFGFKMTKSSALDTLLLNQSLTDPATPAQTHADIQLVSKTTADTLPAIIGRPDGREPGTGIVAGALRDCQGREISNFIATVSSTPATATTLDGALTYYFDPAGGLPTRHSLNPDGSANGLFMVLDIPPAATAYVQMWGYATAEARDADTLTLIAELQTPVIAETVITGSYRPLRTGE